MFFSVTTQLATDAIPPATILNMTIFVGCRI